MLAPAVHSGVKTLLQAFDWHTVLLAKHAGHVVLIHFPIALFLTGCAFDVLAQKTRHAAFATLAHYNLLIAAVSVIPVVITGVVAWQWALEGMRLTGALLLHLVFGGASALLICLVGVIHWRTRRRNRPLPLFRLPIEAIAAVLVAMTAHLGGFLTGVNVPR